MCQLQMSNLLIGSSNLYRHYKAANFPNVRKFKMVNCTKMSGLQLIISTLFIYLLKISSQYYYYLATFMFVLHIGQKRTNK